MVWTRSQLPLQGVMNSFLAGVLSSSLLWFIGLRIQIRIKKGPNGKDNDNDQQPSRDDEDDEPKGNGAELNNKSQSKPSKGRNYDQLVEDETNSFPFRNNLYNPWQSYKNKYPIEHFQLLKHLQKPSLVWGAILHKSRRSTSLKGNQQKRTYIRWPWESLRKKPLEIAKDGNQTPTPQSVEKRRRSLSCLEVGRSDEAILNSLVRNGTVENDKVDQVRVGIDHSVSEHGDSSPILDNLKKDLCIGSIFGLDVGGTLSKLVYFEKKKQSESEVSDLTELTSSVSRHDKPFRRSSSLVPGDFSTEIPKGTDVFITPTREKDRSRQSLPDLLDMSMSGRKSPTKQSPYTAIYESPNTNGQQQQMKRSKSMFDVKSKALEREEALDRFYAFARQLDTHESASGVKESSLSFYSRALGGEFHFLQFETRYLSRAMDLIREHELHWSIVKMGATGGGAHKYASDWKRILGIEIDKKDELDSMVAGMQFILADVVGECYTYKPNDQLRTEESSIRRSTSLSHANHSTKIDTNESSDKETNKSENKKDAQNGDTEVPQKPQLDQYWWSKKVKREFVADGKIYPYLLVMIGTGVSVLRVDGPRKHERISGSTIGGGTYYGLCRLLTDVENFESVLDLAERGDPSKIDMMVGDIYGQNSNALDKLGLTPNIVASSFGKLVAKQDPASGLTQEDLARALLLMVTNNIGQVAYLNAQLHNTKRIYFVGNFLRHNSISQKRLAYAINYWSKGNMEALFLEHEGYFGALGSFLLHQGITHDEVGRVPSRKDRERHAQNRRRENPFKKKRSMSI